MRLNIECKEGKRTLGSFQRAFDKSYKSWK